MGLFDKHYSDEVAEVTGAREYQTADIKIFDPNEGFNPGDYNYETGEWENGSEPTPIYEGQARFIGLRTASNAGVDVLNPTSIKAGRVQIPQHAVGLVKRGMKITFTAVPKNPALSNRIATLDSDIQGASAATRTFDVYLDVEAVTASG